MNKLLEKFSSKLNHEIATFLLCFVLVVLMTSTALYQNRMEYKLIPVDVSYELSEQLKAISTQMYSYCNDNPEGDDYRSYSTLENGEYFLRVKKEVIYSQKKCDHSYDNSFVDSPEKPVFLGFSSDRSAYIYTIYENDKRILRLVHNDSNIEEFKLPGGHYVADAKFINQTNKIAFIMTNPLTEKQYISYHGEKISCELDEIYEDFTFSSDSSHVLYLGFDAPDGLRSSKRIFYVGLNEKLNAINAQLITDEEDVSFSVFHRRMYNPGFSPDEKYYVSG